MPGVQTGRERRVSQRCRFTPDTRRVGDDGPVRRLRALPWKRLLLLGLPGAVLAVLVALGVGYAVTDIPPASAVSQEQATVLRYADGSELGRLGTNREILDIGEISEPAQKAVLAAEDRGFYTEPGISPKGIARALFTNVRGGGSVQQGGSTITQQYAKNAFLTSERTYRRKVKEVFIALKMTRQRDKSQILADYLNTIYFGRGAYGIEAASAAYFGPGVHAKDLTAEQGAVLASSIRSPAGYDPVRHRARARERWNYVLDGMVGQDWLSAQDRAAARYPKVRKTATAGIDLSEPIGHVVGAVQDELLAKGFDEDEVARGGLDITTTIDKKGQEAAVRAVEQVNGGKKGDKALQGALVSVEPGTGAVRAYYAGANGTGLDQAGGVVPTDGPDGGLHQPGSSFKPYVLAAALRDGIPLTHVLDGSSPREFPDGQTIRNFEGESTGQVDLVQATEESVNTAYYDLALQVGAPKVAELARAAGVRDDAPLAEPDGNVRTIIALGAYYVHVTDQAAGYAAFANGGEEAAPYLVQKVVRDGKPTYRAQPETRRAFSKDVAADATYAMQQVVLSGTGVAAQLAGGRPAAGKTGTTSDNKDVWFAGFTPQLATAVWFGYGRPRTITIPGLSTQATGGSVSASVWKQYMDVALQGQPVEDFPPRAFVGGATPAPTQAYVPPAPPAATTAPPATTTAPAPTTAAPTRSATATPTPPPTPTPTPTRTTPPPTTTRPPAPTPTRTPTPAPTTSSPTPSRSPGADPTGPPG